MTVAATEVVEIAGAPEEVASVVAAKLVTAPAAPVTAFPSLDLSKENRIKHLHFVNELQFMNAPICRKSRQLMKKSGQIAHFQSLLYCQNPLSTS